MNKADPATVCEDDPGEAAALRPALFQPYNPAGQAPHQGPLFGTYGAIPELLRLGLRDPRLRFFQEPQGDPAGEDPLIGVLEEWLGGSQAVSVLDFSGVPAEAADLAIGVILNLLFELAVRTPIEGPGIGRPSPVLIVLEEAHRYLGEGATALTRDAANRIAREGRKYGTGLLLVTQRPAELPDTALAQCGTLIALRLANSSDQTTIRAALPDSVAGLAAVLPSLRTGEAVISGEALVPDVRPALAAWRGTYDPPE
jgi:DNA helicase HerA-like ATPase